jgi:hypothetical protein
MASRPCRFSRGIPAAVPVLIIAAHLVIAHAPRVPSRRIGVDPQSAMAQRSVDHPCAVGPKIPSKKILEPSPFYPRKTVCELHGTRMRVDVIPIVYGYPPPGYDIDRVEEEAIFPNAADVFVGGCLGGEETHARVTYCPRCRAEKAAWLARHPDIDAIGNR